MIKNVIVVCDYGYIEGGAARVAHDTAFALHEAGLNVVFFCAVGPVSDALTNSGIRVVCLNQADILHEKNRVKGVLRGINNKVAKITFTQLLNEFNAEETVVHVHTWTKAVSSIIFKVADKKGFKVLVTVHDYFLVCPNGGLFNYQTRKICIIKPMSAKCIACNCDARSYPQKLFRVLRQRKQNKNVRKRKNVYYAFISEFSKREFLKRYDGIPQDRQFFLPNLIEYERDRFRVECENNDKYLFIGGLTEVKGIRIFCEAVTRAKVPAIVIGDGILREELEKNYPEIEFTGWKTKDEMLPYIKQARCLIFPSIWYETMGLVPLEVMSYGVPVICSELNAASEYVPADLHYDGTCEGLVTYIDSMDADDLVCKYSNFIYSSFNLEDFSKDKYFNKLIEVFNKMLTRKH